MRNYILAATMLVAFAIPASAHDGDDPASGVSAERLRGDVETMIGFGTRHTLSTQSDPDRGIGAAINWGMDEFSLIGAECDGCLETRIVQDEVSGRRIPNPVLVRNAVAIQWGSERPNEVVIIQGHIDSRGSDVMDGEIEAPGANDNASGSALVLEAARALSQREYPTTIVYALLSGEEQGLYGGNILADYVTAQGWTVKAVLNNDVVGGSCGSDGVCDPDHVRVFSEGVRADASDQVRAAMRSRGGANDSPSRNLSRWLDMLAGEHDGGVDVRQTWRSDRMGRGGDHLPFLDRGYPAIRFSVAIEDYEHQHQDLRTENGVAYGDTIEEMDFAYLAQVTRLNVRAADVLLRTPMPPRVIANGIVRPDVEIIIQPSAGAVSYNIYRRATDARDWEWRSNVRPEDMPEGERDGPIDVILSPDRGDDWIFGISAVAADGSESPVASAVPGGDFYPLEVDSED